jgi:hypothetical protein
LPPHNLMAAPRVFICSIAKMELDRACRTLFVCVRGMKVMTLVTTFGAPRSFMIARQCRNHGEASDNATMSHDAIR